MRKTINYTMPSKKGEGGGNKPKEEIVNTIFNAIGENPYICENEIADRADRHPRTVKSWLKLIKDVQGRRRLMETKTTRNILYYLEDGRHTPKK